ncbi:MAG: cellulose biosynthesis protein BcsS [Bradyrhizobiaceae bacterium]|nr:cellulose biosynthesis protein BcsS [Bradyrhizobiaceae bacterium]
MRNRTIRVLAGAAALAAAFVPAPAQPADAPLQMVSPEPWSLRDRLFFFGGADLARDSRFAWAGMTGAPDGLLHEDGLRIRVAGGVGRYRYRTGALPGGTNEVDVTSGELLVGYRHALGTTTITAYAGALVENQDLHMPDPGHSTAGTSAGVKAALEFFNRPAENWFVAASAAASSVNRNYHGRIAAAHEHPSGFALGAEASIHGDKRYSEPRAGLFVQRTFGRTNFALSGGYLHNSDRGDGAYGSFSVYAPY